MDIRKAIKALGEFVENNSFTVNKKDFFLRSVIDILDELDKERSTHLERIDLHISRIQEMESDIALIARDQLKETEIKNIWEALRDDAKCLDPQPQEELKPCPFCGNVGVHKSKDANDFIYYVCRKCSAKSGSNKIEAYALENWNGRSNA